MRKSVFAAVCAAASFLVPAACWAADSDIVVNTPTAAASCLLSVDGTVTSTPKLPATAVTIDYLPPGGGASVRLGTNLPLKDGAYHWAGAVPGYMSIAAGGQVRVTTNRQVSAMGAVTPSCGS
ncbi:hypothetical protein FBZ87_10179 [Nitrospirillum amazonense]|uniref:Uncharacterized protein n=2 Tax=Nitrospirillum amazonense TaxID=28077 RepID=A0A560KGP4_9PROT|nr:hypothetical protein [Nitrospirillum amazonense]TWB82376.1 hypothetical protein FBZ87_10179 [Nitrospirillum amazonense]